MTHPDDIFVDEGPIHLNTFDAKNEVSTFTDYDPDKCRQSPDGKHDFTGDWIEIGGGGSATCKYCGLDAMSWGMRCLP
jgi:hypothetical protein